MLLYLHYSRDAYMLLHVSVNLPVLFLWLDFKCLQVQDHTLFTFVVFIGVKKDPYLQLTNNYWMNMYFNVTKRGSREPELTHHFLKPWALRPSRNSWVTLCHLLICNDCTSTIKTSKFELEFISFLFCPHVSSVFWYLIWRLLSLFLLYHLFHYSG